MSNESTVIIFGSLHGVLLRIHLIYSYQSYNKLKVKLWFQVWQIDMLRPKQSCGHFAEIFKWISVTQIIIFALNVTEIYC